MPTPWLTSLAWFTIRNETQSLSTLKCSWQSAAQLNDCMKSDVAWLERLIQWLIIEWLHLQCVSILDLTWRILFEVGLLLRCHCTFVNRIYSILCWFGLFKWLIGWLELILVRPFSAGSSSWGNRDWRFGKGLRYLRLDLRDSGAKVRTDFVCVFCACICSV